MVWTENMNYKSEEVDNEKVALGLKDVANELNKIYKLAETLQKEQKDYSENLLKQHSDLLEKEKQALRKAKKEDLEALASEFALQIQGKADKGVTEYFSSIEKSLNNHLMAKDEQVGTLGQDIDNLKSRLNFLNNRIDNIKSTERLQKQKQFFQEIVFILGAIIATLGTLLLVFAFCSALYSFGWHFIWHWKQITPVYNAPTFQKVLFIGIKAILSILFFIFGLLIMFFPLAIYHNFLNRIENSYRGFGGWLNKIFIRK